MGGSFDEAKDIFQDALVIYYEKSIASAISINSNEKAYLLGISKHLWLRKFKDNNLIAALDGIEITSDANEDQPSETKLNCSAPFIMISSPLPMLQNCLAFREYGRPPFRNINVWKK
jgi:DNA-directed RNA polymerase specialized sigma24 family protein